MGYDCVGDMDCAKPYPLPTHTTPSNGDLKQANDLMREYQKLVKDLVQRQKA